MRKTITTLLGVVTLTLAALPLQATAEEPSTATASSTANAAPAKKNPWTDCGIGAMIFDNTKWAAAISNVIWDYGTTAVTSNISSDHTCSGKQVVAALFINETYANIEEETANGSGAHVTAMLNILGCDPSAQQAIVQSLRSDLDGYVQKASYSGNSTSQKAQDYYQMLDTKITTQYSQQCHAI